MNNPPAGENQLQHAQSPDQNEIRELNYRDLTSDEVAVIRECSKEAFYKRCVPFAAVAATGIHLMVRSGKLSPHPKFGSIPKTAVAVLVAYFMGKISYQRTCDEKIMAIPNSRLAAMVRRKYTKNIGDEFDQSQQWTPGMQAPGVANVQPMKIKEDYHSPVFDSNSNKEIKGLAENRRPTLDSEVSHPKYEPSHPQINYDELRKQNRDDYNRQTYPTKVPARQDVSQSLPISSDSYSSSFTPTGDDQKYKISRAPVTKPTNTRIRKNQYGDTIED